MGSLPGRIWLLLLILNLTVLELGTSVAAAPFEEPAQPADRGRPNLVFVMTDDQAVWTVGAYGNTEVRTPNMDRLAEEGVRFSRAFVNTPVCSPSRATLFTGLYPTQFGIADWISPEEAEKGAGLSQELPTWPEVLQGNGYSTALIGKWHLGSQPDHHPLKHGFDHFYGFLEGGNVPMNPTLEVGGKKVELKGSLPDLLTDEAIRFIREKRQAGPFAVVLSFRAPHAPFTPVPEVDSGAVKDLRPTIPGVTAIDRDQIEKWTREYYGSVHSVDRNLGRLLAELSSIGLEENTIVVFTSDNGYMIGQHRLWSKGNAHTIAGGVVGPKRPNMFEESIAIPLIVRWPGVSRRGSTVDRAVSFIDFFPTLLAMLEIRVPDGAKLEGHDFSPLLKGEAVDWDETIFGQYDLHNSGLAYMRMIRTPHWKLVRHYYANFLDELYDLESDPGETNNLYRDAGAEEIRRRLELRLGQWQKTIGDPILEDPRAVSP